MHGQSTQFDEEYYVRKAQAGDRDALAQLFRQYHNLAFYIALRLCHCDADAEDIVQESFIELERSIANLQEPKYFKAWLNRVIFSKSTKLFRQNRDVNLNQDESMRMKQKREERRYLLPDADMKFQNDREVLLHFLQCLPHKLSSCLYMMYFEQMSVKEIAFALNIPEGTVKSRVSNAKAELKSMIVSYEQREQTKLDFRCGSLEGALALVLAHDFEKLCGAFLVKGMRLGSYRELIQKLPRNVVVFGSACMLSVSVLGTGVFWMRNQFADGRSETLAQQIRYEFTPVAFQGELLMNAREAYIALVNTAHCMVEIEQLDEHTKQELKTVYQALKKNGGVYYGLLYHRAYAEAFE